VGRKYCSAWRSYCDAVSPSKAANRARGCSWRRKRADRLKGSSRKMEEQFWGGEQMLGTNWEFCSRRETMRLSWQRSTLTLFGDSQCQVKATTYPPILATRVRAKKKREKIMKSAKMFYAPDDQQAMAERTPWNEIIQLVLTRTDASQIALLEGLRLGLGPTTKAPETVPTLSASEQHGSLAFYRLVSAISLVFRK